MKPTWVYPLTIAGLLVAGILFCLCIESEFHAAAIIVPAIVIICVASIAVFARKDPFLFRVLILALTVKLLASWIYTLVPAFQLSDVMGIYFDSAKQFAQSSMPF